MDAPRQLGATKHPSETAMAEGMQLISHSALCTSTRGPISISHARKFERLALHCRVEERWSAAHADAEPQAS